MHAYPLQACLGIIDVHIWSIIFMVDLGDGCVVGAKRCLGMYPNMAFTTQNITFSKKIQVNVKNFDDDDDWMVLQIHSMALCFLFRSTLQSYQSNWAQQGVGITQLHPIWRWINNSWIYYKHLNVKLLVAFLGRNIVVSIIVIFFLTNTSANGMLQACETRWMVMLLSNLRQVAHWF